MNCGSYLGGSQNVWKTEKRASHYTPPLSEFASQKFNDGKIEFVAYKNQLDIGLEKFSRRAAKVAQGTGPFLIEATNGIRNKEVYMHADG